jgi:chaperone BCS1
MIDPMQILEVTLYSKLLNEASSHFLLLEKMNIIYIVFAFFIYKLVTLNYVQDLMYKLKDIIVERYLNSYSSMTVSGHTKSYFSGFGSSKQVTKILYSKKFKAITHYLLKKNNKEISNFNEVMKAVHSNYYDEDTLEYVMLPEYNQKILLCNTNNISLEIIVNEKTTLEDEKDNKKKTTTDKFYIYKLTTPQRFNYSILGEFVKMCEDVYDNDVNNKKTHMVFEYLSSEKDEDGRSKLLFREYTFKSNKFLDKNIYFEGKEKLIEYVDKFKVKKDDDVMSEYEKEYEEVGVTFKASLLLRGPPGCGKSCTIRGILNRTGRHGVIVTWSKLKTCADVCSLFRQTIINDKKYTMDQLCFIFEDFDANCSDILKKRSSKVDGSNVLSSGGVTKLLKNNPKNKLDDDIDEECENKSTPLTDLEKLMLLNKSHIEDELTLECVLNVLDGIIELHNVMIIFTTNHLEQIDPAFTRSGRIDFHLEFTLATVNIIKEMLQTIRKIDVANTKYKKYFDKMMDYVISPADVQNICFKYKNENVTEILNDIIALCNENKKLK